MFDPLAPVELKAWSGIAIQQAISGARNQVWRARLAGRTVSVRRSRRSVESLEWELSLIDHLGRSGFEVPTVLAADDGRAQVNGVVVQSWLEGDAPSTEQDWHRVADELERLHRQGIQLLDRLGQRPGCCSVLELADQRRSVDADLDRVPVEVIDLVVQVFEACSQVPTRVIHGDVHPGNIRIGPDGTVGLLDWDESRADLFWHDLSNLGVAVLDPDHHRLAEALSHGWETVNGWVAEPEYARSRLAQLIEIWPV